MVCSNGADGDRFDVGRDRAGFDAAEVEQGIEQAGESLERALCLPRDFDQLGAVGLRAFGRDAQRLQEEA
jgi:hypothetical protein